MDAYAEAPFDVGSRVDALAEVSRAVEERLRTAAVLPATYPEWAAVRDVLERMRMSLAGGDVEVPAAYVVPLLAGARLARFQELAAALDESTAGAHSRARQELDGYPGRGAQFVGELHYFAALTKDVRARADTGSVSPRAVGPVVDDLLKEAREADRRMRGRRRLQGGLGRLQPDDHPPAGDGQPGPLVGGPAGASAPPTTTGCPSSCR